MLAGSWQYWINLRALPTVLFSVSSGGGVSLGWEKLFWGFLFGEQVGETPYEFKFSQLTNFLVFHSTYALCSLNSTVKQAGSYSEWRWVRHPCETI